MKYQLILFEKNQNNLSRTLLFENLVVKCTKNQIKMLLFFTINRLPTKRDVNAGFLRGIPFQLHRRRFPRQPGTADSVVARNFVLQLKNFGILKIFQDFFF